MQKVHNFLGIGAKFVTQPERLHSQLKAKNKVCVVEQQLPPTSTDAPSGIQLLQAMHYL